MRAAEVGSSQSVSRANVMVPLRVAWNAARFPVLALLEVLQPVVRFALGAIALLLVLTSLFLEAVTSRPIPLVGMLGCAVGCVALLRLYQALIRLLS